MKDKKQGKKHVKKALKITEIIANIVLFIVGLLILAFFCSLGRYIINLFR